MSSLQYSQVQPDNNKSQFNPLDTVIFTLNNAGRSLVLGSVKLEGKLRVNSTGTTRAVSTQDIRFNQNAGVASFIDSVATSTSNQSPGGYGCDRGAARLQPKQPRGCARFSPAGHTCSPVQHCCL